MQTIQNPPQRIEIIESEASIGRVVVDSRQVQPRDIFWALPGMSRDGADFIDDAWRRGAAGVVSARTVTPPPGRWLLKVSDSLLALWDLAGWQRRQFAGRVFRMRQLGHAPRIK